jgi:hypothetical protein
LHKSEKLTISNFGFWILDFGLRDLGLLQEVYYSVLGNIFMIQTRQEIYLTATSRSLPRHDISWVCPCFELVGDGGYRLPWSIANIHCISGRATDTSGRATDISGGAISQSKIQNPKSKVVGRAVAWDNR